jgi:putative FmdB family regulatory protein
MPIYDFKCAVCGSRFEELIERIADARKARRSG